MAPHTAMHLYMMFWNDLFHFFTKLNLLHLGISWSFLGYFPLLYIASCDCFQHTIYQEEYKLTDSKLPLDWEPLVVSDYILFCFAFLLRLDHLAQYLNKEGA